MLPVNVVARQVFSRYMIEIIYINIDVIAIMRVIAVVIVVIVMVVVIIIIPVDTAKQRPGSGHAQAVTEAFDEAIGKLLPGRRRQVDRRIGAVWPGTIDGRGVIAGNIDHLRIGRFYFNNLRGRRRRRVGGGRCCRAAGGNRCGRGDNHFLLWRGFQCPGLLGNSTQALHRVHHIMRLGQKRIAEVLHPRRIFAHHRQQGRESDKGFDAGIPRLTGNRLNRRIPFHRGVILGPLYRLHDVVGISGGHQHLRQQTVRVERDGRDPLINLRLGVGGGHRLRCGRR